MVVCHINAQIVSTSAPSANQQSCDGLLRLQPTHGRSQRAPRDRPRAMGDDLERARRSDEQEELEGCRHHACDKISCQCKDTLRLALQLHSAILRAHRIQQARAGIDESRNPHSILFQPCEGLPLDERSA